MEDAPNEDTFGAEAEMREGGADIAEDDDSDEEWVNAGGDDDDEMDPETRRNLDMAQRDSNKRALLQDAENEDLQFPDEMDTPSHCHARDRFAKYRGLKSFRSSPWDPKESLPYDYARVFAFENFKRAYKRALEIQEEDAPGGAPIGTYVRVTILNVPRVPAMALFQGQGRYEPPHPNMCPRSEDGRIGAGVGPMWTGWVGGAGPTVISGLLQFESCLSLMNYCITKSPHCDVPLKSKAPLWFHVGFRRERAGPLYSTDNLGEKHKLERFLRGRLPTIASVYGPITYGPAPVIGFKECFTQHGVKADLAVTGSVRDANPDRIILKRVILSAVPFRTHKHKAVARHMFFDPNDIRWFKPLELWTKYGLRGKIVEPVGTHGRMKCIFNNVIHQHDTICATLYKRIFPKFAAGEHAHR
jgi:pre-rRNA-processing protein TSR1